MTQSTDPKPADPDLGPIGPGHVCKHGIHWPHECSPCADAAWAAETARAAESDPKARNTDPKPGEMAWPNDLVLRIVRTLMPILGASPDQNPHMRDHCCMAIKCLPSPFGNARAKAITDPKPGEMALRECPFCGSKPNAYDAAGKTVIGCDCGMVVSEALSWREGLAQMVEGWNTRAKASAPVGVDALRVRELCHVIIRACGTIDGGPHTEMAKEAASLILAEMRRAAQDEEVPAVGVTVTDEMVEAGALAFVGKTILCPPWCAITSRMKDNVRECMRAALEAALEVKP